MTSLTLKIYKYTYKSLNWQIMPINTLIYLSLDLKFD